ncbi:hypothetical protein ACH4SP_23315 [Streptomyces sp. NPDC021093]|uniref:hypothetical protein n=1 Tax=Streptomyces sp. NPDC021093 TaxID=3365112 RepID=UPI0037AE21B1
MAHTDGQPPYPRSPFSTAKPRRRLRATPFQALLVVGGLLLGVGTAWFVRGPDPTPLPPAPTALKPAPQPAPKPAPEPKSPSRGAGSATPAASPTPTLPADFAVVRDLSGAVLAVPTGWRRSVEASVYYRAPGTPYTRFLQFWPLAESGMSATRALRVTVATHRHLPGFTLKALHPTTRGAAELVYSYDSTRVGRRLTFVQRVFPVPDGRRYALAVVGPAAEWPRQKVVLETALRHFEAEAR